jgi:putative FmdB family regulatory protein
MPIYEYRCEKCGMVNEILVLGREESLSCKSCGSSELSKLMSAPNISMGGPSSSFSPPSGGCCGAPGSCDSPGHCCGS